VSGLFLRHYPFFRHEVHEASEFFEGGRKVKKNRPLQTHKTLRKKMQKRFLDAKSEMFVLVDMFLDKMMIE